MTTAPDFPRCTLYATIVGNYSLIYKPDRDRLMNVFTGPISTARALLAAFAAAGVHTIDSTAPATTPDAADRLAADLVAGRPCSEADCPRCPPTPTPPTEADKAYALVAALADAASKILMDGPYPCNCPQRASYTAIKERMAAAREAFTVAALRERYAAAQPAG